MLESGVLQSVLESEMETEFSYIDLYLNET